MAIEVNIPKPIIDLPEVLENGNETTGNDIVLTANDRVVVGANRAGLSKGTFDTSRGGDKGVSLQCANDLELNWQSGYVRVLTPNGDGTPLLLNSDSEIVYTELVPTTPTYEKSLVTKDYADTKVEKIEGKGLSENDFTNTLKTKLDGIEDGAQVNVNADWNATSGDAEILNKPTIPSAVTKTSDLTNDGEDGVNPFITALDIPTSGQAGTLVREVKNMTGATLTKGTVVFISGANGNKPLVSKALAVSDALSSRTFGLLQSNILNNGVGYCVVIGDLSGLDTSAFTEGAQLYLSGTVAGTFTETKNLAPTHLVYVGKVTRSHPTQGQIEVQIQNGYELNEIHDVAISSVANNETLVYESATTLWKNKALTSSDVGAVPTTRNITINGTTQDLSADRTFTIGNKFSIIGNPVITAAAGLTRFVSPFQVTNSTSENARSMVIPFNVTINKLYIGTGNVQPVTGSSVFTLRKNGVATSIVTTVPAGSASGVFVNAVNSVSFSAGDLVSIEHINNALVNSATINQISISE